MILDLLFPKQCIVCRKLGRHICLSCKSKLRYLTSDVCPGCFLSAERGETHIRCQKRTSLDGVISLFVYDHAMKKLIKGVKYRLLFDIFNELLAETEEMKLGKFIKWKEQHSSILIQPVPLHRRRENKRGFNQSEILARFFSRKLGIPVVSYIKRTTNTTPQAFIANKKEREKNISGAFDVVKDVFEGKTVVLVDDVFTSGSTTNELAKLIKKHKASKVYVFSLAHGSFK